MEVDFTVFEREVHRRLSDGEHPADLASEFRVPLYVIQTAGARGDSALLVAPDAEFPKSYEARLYTLAHERQGLFQLGEMTWDTEVDFADKAQQNSGPDTDDIEDPFAPLDEWRGDG